MQAKLIIATNADTHLKLFKGIINLSQNPPTKQTLHWRKCVNNVIFFKNPATLIKLNELNFVFLHFIYADKKILNRI